MCGIIGYIGKKEAAQILLAGLQRMEYRGYDSAGIAIAPDTITSDSLKNTKSPASKSLTFIKSVGKIAQLQAKVAAAAALESSHNDSQKKPTHSVHGTIGIGHTRWATHGVPSVENAHPHASENKDIAVVHNGIIENASVLRAHLQSEGFTFASQTDTETIVHLIDFHLRKLSDGVDDSEEKRATSAKRKNGETSDADFETAFRLAVSQLQGTYGIVALSAGSRTLYVARKGSPLIIGVGSEGSNEMFVASDAAALIANTRTVQYLQDGEIAVITEFGYNISTLAGDSQPKSTSKIEWSLQEAELSGHSHFMQKEIFEQPAVVQNTIQGRFRDGRVKLSLKFPATVNKVYIVACGTSYHAGLLGKQYIESHARIPVEVCYASEFRYSDPVLQPNDIVVAISQSGETADTLAAIVEAKRRNVTTIGLVNVVGSTIAREVDSGIYTHAGIEVGVASTKAFTCQAVSLLLLSLSLAQHVGKQLPAGIQSHLLSLSEYIDSVLDLDDEMKRIAQTIVDSQSTSAIFLGRHLAYPIALEGALKLKEISYIHAEGFAAGEMKHGPIALIDENMPVICIVQQNHVTDKMISNMQEIKARRGRIIAVSEVSTAELVSLCDELVIVPHVAWELSPILLNIPLQLLAYHVAVLKGLDVDKPRNLAKSVTVE